MLTATSIQDAFITVFQLGPLIEGVKTLISGEQTTELVAGKKLDAVARSMPSMVLQLFSLLISLSTITDQSYSILAVSIALGALGSATTLASMAPKSGRHLFKYSFFMHISYYFSELLV
jgi:heme O synthase-like polyprenyltransferase